jgi:ubiquinone/menaquinone biosynthesis C-methylase UbiE
MGAWSRLAGEVFLDWLAPRARLRWVDVGCGTGAFCQLVFERCAPAEIQGVDPSEAQLAFARTRPASGVAQFQRGDATALPFAGDRFDAAIMALVIFFVPDPAKGVAEMVRVVGPGGTVAAYAWDILGGGIPTEPILAASHAPAVDFSVAFPDQQDERRLFRIFDARFDANSLAGKFFADIGRKNPCDAFIR